MIGNPIRCATAISHKLYYRTKPLILLVLSAGSVAENHAANAAAMKRAAEPVSRILLGEWSHFDAVDRSEAIRASRQYHRPERSKEVCIASLQLVPPAPRRRLILNGSQLNIKGANSFRGRLGVGRPAPVPRCRAFFDRYDLFGGRRLGGRCDRFNSGLHDIGSRLALGASFCSRLRFAWFSSHRGTLGNGF